MPMKLRVKQAAAALIKNLFGNLLNVQRTTTPHTPIGYYLRWLFDCEFLRDRQIILAHASREKIISTPLTYI